MFVPTWTLISTKGYSMQDFDIETADNANGPWRKLFTFRNWSTHIFTFPGASYRFRFIRMVGRRGPARQPQYVRVNEFEVYSEIPDPDPK